MRACRDHVGSGNGSGSMGLKFSRYLRGLMTSAALAAVVALAGCETDGLHSGKAMKSLSPEMVAALQQKNMPTESPILVRLFKEEAELEVWKQDAAGRYDLLKTYPICRWSGELGPKIKEGDRQAPEGFYTITPAQMNPNSQFYLSFNMGYPNAFDRAHGRTGAHLMVHGDCSSRGCYAMTDDQIGEIYALARESFFGGQRSFQVQAYPFRMTPANFAKHRNNPNIPFWRMLKEGNDHFEITRQEPKVDVCEKRYVFNADSPQKLDAGRRHQARHAMGRLPGAAAAAGFAEVQSDRQVPGLRGAARRGRRGEGEAAPGRPADRRAVAAHDRGADPHRPRRRHASDLPRQAAAAGSARARRHGALRGRSGGRQGARLLRQSAARDLSDRAETTGTAVASAPRAAPKQQQKSGPGGRRELRGRRRRSRARRRLRRGPSRRRRFSSLFASTSDSRSEGVFGRMKTSVGRLFGSTTTSRRRRRGRRKARGACAEAGRASAADARAAAEAAQAQQPQQPAARSRPPQAAPTPARQSAASGASLMSGAAPTVPTGSFSSRWGGIQ